MTLTDKPAAYLEGVRTRLDGNDYHCGNPYVGRTKIAKKNRDLWRAGWNDTDSELTPLERAVSKFREDTYNELDRVEATP